MSLPAGVKDDLELLADNQRDATLQVNLLFLVPLYVSGNVFAHHQEHLTVFTASGNIIHCNNKFVITNIVL
jgi:hypothetical protein